jgi:hypothetical protein
MMFRNKLARIILAFAALAALLGVACSLGISPTPITLEHTVIETVEVTRIVEVTQQVVVTELVESTLAVGGYPAAMLEGRWEETWGVGDDTDVTYHDVYEISADPNGEITVVCPDRPEYVFEPGIFDGKTLEVSFVNGEYVVTYRMHFDESGSMMIGTAETNHGVLARVVWAKLEDG